MLRSIYCLVVLFAFAASSFGHGTAIYPESRVYNVYLSGPESPDFELAEEAVDIDGSLSYYTWNEVSRLVPDAVDDDLPEGFDYSEWVPDGEIASGGRTDPDSDEYPRTYAGLDQVSEDWPTTTVAAGDIIEVDFYATATHDPSVWDVWMTTTDWDPTEKLNWDQMEFLERPDPELIDGHYYFDLEIPTDRSGHHVLWIAWQRDDAAGEVFFSTSDLLIDNDTFLRGDANGDGDVTALLDAIFILAYAFVDGDEPPCMDAADVDGNDEVSALTDALYLLEYGFSGGEGPPDPGPIDCGVDPEEDDVTCETLPEACE